MAYFEEEEYKKRVENLTIEENKKNRQLREIEDKIKYRDGERISLENNLKERDQILGDLNQKAKELYELDQSIGIKAQKLSRINIELMELEKKNSVLNKDVQTIENIRNDLKIKLDTEKETAVQMEEQNKKLRELVPLLEKRKAEIEESNSELENRFSKMFQKFSKELNEINKKRSVLEQIVLKKEKDIDEHDQSLFEKISALEESERVLDMRKAELETLENLVKNTGQQKEMLNQQLEKIIDELNDRKNFNNDIRFETELLQKKRNNLDQEMKELFSTMVNSYDKSSKRRILLQNEMQNYDEQLQAVKEQVSGAMKELIEIQNSIGNFKIQQENQKADVNKMASIKKKLQDEISKHQIVLQRYQKLRDKFKIDQSVSKSKQAAGPYPGASANVNQHDTEMKKNPAIYKI